MAAIFPKWTNHIPTAAALAVVLGGITVVGVVSYWFSPNHTDVGYAPAQPVAYSHKLHAGTMGLDCRYCHTSVEDGPHANVPPTQTCMNCHTAVLKNSEEIQKIHAAHNAGEPLRWKKVHMLPDYAFFNHAAHVRANVGCKSCHGRIDQMEVVRQVEPLSMGWCLECHRNPAPHVRPEGVSVTDMEWEPTAESIAAAEKLLGDRGRPDGSEDPATEQLKLNPPEHCSACHR